MRFDRITLRNFKPYGDADLELGDGVTVIHGLNGSGKSSLLEACFFALYGSKALDGTLEDVITNGEEETEVTLAFTHDGGRYRIDRRLKDYGDRVGHDCTLEGPDGLTRDGATAVRAFVADLLRMDAEAFVNCAYVRQGEVNKLINATPSERQDTIDDLLQLGTLEEYRDRAGDARLGVEDVLTAKRTLLEDLDDRIAEKEAKDLHGRLNDLESDLAELDEQVENYEQQRETAVETREEAAAVLDAQAERREELREVESTVEELEAAIREDESEREAHKTEIRETRERIAELEAEIDDRLEAAGLDAATEAAVEERRAALDAREEAVQEDLSDARVDAEAFRNQAENLADKADDLADRADELEDEADDLDERADEAASEADERAERLDDLAAEAETLSARFADAVVDRGEATERRETLREERGTARERVAELETELSNARERVAEAEELLDAGKCPECGQPVEDSPHAHRVEEDRERVAELEADLSDARERVADLDDRIDALADLVDAEERLAEIENAREMLEERVAEKREAAETHREEADEKREEADEKREEAADLREVAEEKRAAAAEAAETVETLEADLEDLAEAREAADAVAERLETVADAEARIERLREKRAAIADVNDERRDRLAEKRERRDELREEVDEDAIADAKERKGEAEDYIERVDAELDRLAEKRDEIQSAIGSVNGEIRDLEELREDRADLAETVDALESLHGETEDLESMYGDLRAELRQRNVRELERMLNETFELVYDNDAYSHIELDGEYELTVYQKDGQPLDPEQLSGGERALFNLSLRCAIYRLLAEGIEGAAPTPPLILDEPTVFLDSGHVSRLVDLVEEMRGFGVRQIVIVSHDENLVGAADDLVTVEKDPRTNRSTVAHADPDVASAVLTADDD